MEARLDDITMVDLESNHPHAVALSMWWTYSPQGVLCSGVAGQSIYSDMMSAVWTF
jgi:hypothetical protein